MSKQNKKADGMVYLREKKREENSKMTAVVRAKCD